MGVKELLGGVWLGHPLHPGLVHVPTGLYPAALVCDVLSYTPLGQGRVWVTAGFWCIVAATGVALLAAPAGVADWWGIKPDKPAHRLGLWHMGLNVVVLALFIVNLCLRLDDWRWATRVTAAQLTLSAVGVGIVLVSGYLGGRMVYAHGTSIVRLPQAKAKWRRLAEAGQANVPPAK